MEQKMTKNLPLTRFPDLRTVPDSDEAQLAHRLLRNWPCVPGRDSGMAASALDCLVILVRSIYARVRAESIPKPRGYENGFARYMWALFDQQGDEKQYGRRLSMARNTALMTIKKGAHDIDNLSFAELCRSDAMVEALWKHPRFHLTHPWVIKGPEYPEEGAVCRGHEEISRDTLVWDGLTPTTVEQLVSKVTGLKHSGKNMKLVYFNSPEVIQVDLTAGRDSSCRLVDQWRFQAWTREPDPNDEENEMVSLEKGRQISYIVRAIVRHAAGGRTGTSIRIFREDGAEQLPDGLAVNNPMPDWGFKLGDAIPPGEKLSIFYVYYPVNVDHLPDPREVSQEIQMPANIRAPILDIFKAFEDRENPPAQQPRPQAPQMSGLFMHPDRQNMLGNFGRGTPPNTSSGGQNTQGRQEDGGPRTQLPPHPPFRPRPRLPFSSQPPPSGSSRGRGRPYNNPFITGPPPREPSAGR